MNQITVTAAPPMSQSTALVLSFSRGRCALFVRSLARFFFPFIRLGLSQRFIYRYNPVICASFSPTDSVRKLVLLVLYLVAVDENRTNSAGKENEIAPRAKGNFALD